MQRWIEASTTIRVAFARARDVLLDDPGAIFSDATAVEDRHTRRFRTELSVDLGGGASMHQEVVLQQGVPRSTETTLALPVTWQATGRARLLPIFDGELEVSEARPGTGLRLTGTYTVPLGVVGRLGNGVVGRWLARRSLDALVERLAGRLESEDQRLDSPVPTLERVPVALPVYEHPEIYVG